MTGKIGSSEINVDFFGKNIKLSSVKEVTNLKIIFYTICALSLLASFFMIYITISYNFDVIKKKGLKDEIKEELIAINQKEKESKTS